MESRCVFRRLRYPSVFLRRMRVISLHGRTQCTICLSCPAAQPRRPGGLRRNALETPHLCRPVRRDGLRTMEGESRNQQCQKGRRLGGTLRRRLPRPVVPPESPVRRQECRVPVHLRPVNLRVQLGQVPVDSPIDRDRLFVLLQDNLVPVIDVCVTKRNEMPHGCAHNRKTSTWHDVGTTRSSTRRNFRRLHREERPCCSPSGLAGALRGKKSEETMAQKEKHANGRSRFPARL
mmetsp:Transcript_13328/g.29669  ORF Transcript_13328/g.29669 Transcript_13328/m.29669 type:complete len:234 (+) Transcript_13328:155-856(+)